MPNTTYFSPMVNVPHIRPEQTSKGSYITVQGLRAYTIGPQGKNAVIVAHDKFGLTPQMEQICDMIASQGYRVIMPYLFKDEFPYTRERALRESSKQCYEWFMNIVSSPSTFDHIHITMKKILTYLQSQGFVHFGVFGAGGGGKFASIAASKSDLFSAAVFVHTPWFSLADLKDIKCPVAILTSGDLEDLASIFFTPSINSLQMSPSSTTKHFPRVMLHMRFAEMKYGWVGSYGEWTNPYIAERTTEALRISATFFREHIGLKKF
ncbi:5138_t:CDS:2 [Ambispora gerdemannii]|uniref:5138_t:CDS:1 n=1 Tax=Ambispora gerdemannii TaxID=144530 RepID=A0A9N9CNY6_9GLOM|nr:5138_t:CDS:2 [Ambispora gerdemannii]